MILPDLAAGCSMADMAGIGQVEDAWDELVDVFGDDIADIVRPVTYMNSSAAIKAFTGRHGGTICTSSNAKTALRWAFDQTGGVDGTGKVLFLPDQHLGRNTAVRELGLSLDECVLWDPHKPHGGVTREQLENARMILWRGHCSVHGRFTVEAVEQARRDIPGVKVIVHPECRYDVCELADEIGSTERIIKTIGAAPDGTSWVVGTELNLVNRLREMYPNQTDRLPGEERLLLLDDEPDRPAPPRLGARVPRGRPRRQPDPRRPRRRALVADRARPDARASRRDCQGLMTALDRVAVVSDVHGNLTAYQAVLADIDARGHHPDRQPGRRRGQGSARSRLRRG